MQRSLIAEFVEAGQFRVMASLAQASQGDVELKFRFDNYATHSLLQLDEQKIFLVDDRGAEFSHEPYAEWKSGLERIIAQSNALAQGMDSVPYIAPPAAPPPTHYHISSSADGYTLTPTGGGAYQMTGQAQVESTVSPEYTPSEQIAQAARGIAAIVDAIRVARTNKEIAKLRARAAANAAGAQKLLDGGIAAHLETTTPISPGAIRTGIVAFTEPRSRDASSVRTIVVRDTSTNQDYFLTSAFHEQIRSGWRRKRDGAVGTLVPFSKRASDVQR
jgi:hypothetical protein